MISFLILNLACLFCILPVQAQQLVDQMLQSESQGESFLYEAAAAGEVGAVSALLAIDSETEISIDGKTALHVAVRNGHFEQVSRLLRAKASLGALDGEGKTPLHLAVEDNSNSAIVEALLDAGADPEKLDGNGSTALQLAKAAGSDEILALLRKRTFKRIKWCTPSTLQSIMVEDKSRFAALPADIRNVIKALLIWDAASKAVAALVMRKVIDEETANQLFSDPNKGHHIMANNLSTGINEVLLSGIDFSGLSLLEIAAYIEKPDVVMQLLFAGATINNNMFLLSTNCNDVARVILSASPPDAHIAEDLESALANKDGRFRSSADQLNRIRLLLSAGAKPKFSTAENHADWHPLAKAWCNRDVAALLINETAIAKQRDEYGATFLMFLMGYRPAKEDDIQRLLDAGADVHAVDNKNFSVVHYAAMNSKYYAVQLLVAAGAPPSTKVSSTTKLGARRTGDDEDSSKRRVVDLHCFE